MSERFAMLHNLVARRRAASANRHARGASVILLAFSTVFLTKHSLSTSYATWVPPQKTCALANGALHADPHQAVGSHITMRSVLSELELGQDVQNDNSSA